MITNEAGVTLIKTYEGLVDGDPNTPGLDPYLCPAGVPTIGYGSIWGLGGRRITMSHRAITEAEAEKYLQRELRVAENAVERLTRVKLNEHEFAALVSFTYNLGSGNLQVSTLRMKLNRGERFQAANEFPKWRRANGIILRGLVRRRADERRMFLS